MGIYTPIRSLHIHMRKIEIDSVSVGSATDLSCCSRERGPRGGPRGGGRSGGESGIEVSRKGCLQNKRV